MRLNELLARLELLVHRVPIPCAFASAQAAHDAGVHGGWLCIQPVMGTAEWTAAAKAQQAELCEVNHGNA